MPRKSTVSLDALIPLGAPRLAQLVLDETETNPAFKKRISAALASTQGPDAVARVIDRRLAALERARSQVAYEKERAFAEDLGATVDTILKELAPLNSFSAIERLLRFVGTNETVFGRIDDSGGRIQAVYWRAAEAIPGLVEKLPPEDRALMPDRLQHSISQDGHGLGRAIAIEVIPLLPAASLAAWDQALCDASGGNEEFLKIRQAIADARGDLETYLALEQRLPVWQQDPLAVAERLLAVRRLDEALQWVRRERKGGLVVMNYSDIADGRVTRPHDLKRVRLEARILEAMQNRPAAQDLRWKSFETTLDANILREHIGKLDDFEEFDELDKAFATAAASSQVYTALAFFIAWPRIDLAAKLVLEKSAIWDGRHYDMLGDAAEVLEEDFPLAATLLYRVLLNDILTRAKSPAYGAGARHLVRLGALAARVSAYGKMEDHVAYVQKLRIAHGRKTGFWSVVAGKNRS